MEPRVDRSLDEVPATLDRELSMIKAAIALVASGGAPRVVLAGLQFAEPLLDSSSRMAHASGVRVVPLWTAEERPSDLAVEPIAP